MNHLEKIKVAFIGSVARQFAGVKYYQNTFKIGTEYKNAKAAEDYSGKAGVVQFLKAGEKMGDKVITSDCFSIIMITDASKIATAKAATEGWD